MSEITSMCKCGFEVTQENLANHDDCYRIPDEVSREIYRLRAEVERLQEEEIKAAVEVAANRLRAEAAEKERDDLRARLAAAEECIDTMARMKCCCVAGSLCYRCAALTKYEEGRK